MRAHPESRHETGVAKRRPAGAHVLEWMTDERNAVQKIFGHLLDLACRARRRLIRSETLLQGEADAATASKANQDRRQHSRRVMTYQGDEAVA